MRPIRPHPQAILLLVLIPILQGKPPPAIASDPPVRELEGAARDSAAAHRILEDVNRLPDPARGLERLTGTIPRHLVMSGLEQALHPQVLRRFGGPGLDLESLRDAVNGDLHAGGTPHLTLAAGLLAHGGIKQAEKLRLPHMKVGGAGGGVGVTSFVSRLDGGFYLLPARVAGEGLWRRTRLQLNGINLPLLRRPPPLRLARLEFELIDRPDPRGLVRTRAVHIQLPCVQGRMRIELGAGMSATVLGSQTTLVRTLAPSIAIRRLAFTLDIQHVDQGATAYLDTALRASFHPLRVETRVRQDPGHRRPPVHETRIASSNLMPWLGW